MDTWTLRDELKERDPKMVNPRLPGGAFGCPSDYFDCALSFDPEKCFPLKTQCEACWSRPYAQERWRPNE